MLPAARVQHLRHAPFAFENRARRLEEGLKRAQDLARQAPPDLPVRPVAIIYRSLVGRAPLSG